MCTQVFRKTFRVLEFALASTTLLVAAMASGEEAPLLADATLLREALDADWIQSNVVWGRLQLSTPRSGIVEYDRAVDGCKESIRMCGCDRSVRLTYERVCVQGRLSLEVTNDGRVTIGHEATCNGETLVVAFQQPATGPISLRLRCGPEDQTYTAPTLWHLWLAQPKQCRQHLGPMLELLGVKQLVSDKAMNIERELFEMAETGSTPCQRHFAAWVEQLAHDDYTEREVADAALRRSGTAVLWYLVPARAEWDAEQRHRILRIYQTLARRPADDTPINAARWLAGDPRVWKTLMLRSESELQEMAREALQRLTNGQALAQSTASHFEARP